ncbi:MAG TPA: ATP-binding protein [Acidimicrobiales bacterium]|nr:ATP-binding protein [Acidimicrobiales bacterium]
MRPVPTSVRFAAMTAGVFLVLLALSGAVLFRQFHLALRSPVDQHLANLAAAPRDAVAGTDPVTGPPEGLLASLADDPPDPLTTNEVEVQVLAADGTVLQATGDLEGAPGLVQGRRLVRVASGVPVYGDAALHGRAVRFLGVSVPDGSERIVVLSMPIEPLREAERTLLAVYVPVALAGSVVAGLAGLWITRRGLAPLRRMTAHAEAIGAYDLSLRLPAPARRDEIGQLARTLNRMRDRLDAAVQRERQFVTDAGHELRTPLAIARAETELVRQELTDVSQRLGLSSAIEEIDRLAGIAEDLLLLARADAASVLNRVDDVDLLRLAANAVSRFSNVAAAGGVSLSAQGEAAVRGDARAIERALSNLVDNAIRHVPSGGRVEILVEPAPPGAVITVRDSGPGVPPEKLGTLFDRFTQAGLGHGGAGLGLSIVAAVAASHEGGVRARNRPEGGLEIALELG